MTDDGVVVRGKMMGATRVWFTVTRHSWAKKADFMLTCTP